MRTPFLPLTNRADIMDRKVVIAAQFGPTNFDDMTTLDFMYLSDRAYRIQEDKRKAAEEGKVYVG